MVFITHDLDEALRLGDRIAILRDGRSHPAGHLGRYRAGTTDEYITAFVKEVNRARVIGSMPSWRRQQHRPSPALRIPTGTTVEEALRQLSAANATAAPSCPAMDRRSAASAWAN